MFTIAKAALNYAWRNDKLPGGIPTFWIKVKPLELGEDPPPRMLELNEITRLLNAAQPDLRELLTAALMTGGRRGELFALQTRDYRSDNGTVRLYQSKTGKTLLQPLTPEGVAFFDRATTGKSAAESIFTRDNGQPWGRSDIVRPMRAAVEAANLDEVSFKTTRATYGKLLLQATKDIEMVAKALGHSDSRITRKHYAQYLPNEIAQAVAKMPSLGVMSGDNVSRIGKKLPQSLLENDHGNQKFYRCDINVGVYWRCKFSTSENVARPTC
ncbi:MAG: site-specific integrase [Luteimonas sp.]